MFTWAFRGLNFTVQASSQLYPPPKWCTPPPLNWPQLSTCTHPADYTADREPSCWRQPIVSALWTKTTSPWCRGFRTFWPQSSYQLLGGFRGSRHDVTSDLLMLREEGGGLTLLLAWRSQVLDKNDTAGGAPGNAKNNMVSDNRAHCWPFHLISAGSYCPSWYVSACTVTVQYILVNATNKISCEFYASKVILTLSTQSLSASCESKLIKNSAELMLW